MGLLSSTCEKCGSDVWLFQKHPREKCWRKEAKNKVRENNLYPIPDTPEHIDEHTYVEWLRTHQYPVENLLYHPHNTKFTSKEGREYLDEIHFSPIHIGDSFDVIAKEIINKNTSQFIVCRNYDILIEIKDTYSIEGLKKYKRSLLLDGDPP
jgi:hypothetical protein